jgi:hypothetical protein
MRSWILLAATLVLMGDVAGARVLTIEVSRSDVEAHTPADAALGAYYTFGLEIPPRLPVETFMHAYLELYVDAATSVDEVSTGGIATLEVYPLQASLSEELRTSDLRHASMKRTVRLGASQRVRVDISEHVRYLLEHPSENSGLAIGSLTGQRLGQFTLRHDGFGTGVAARVTIVFTEFPARPSHAE